MPRQPESVQIPRLQPSKRDREYVRYSKELRAEVVRAWLSEGVQHRTIDIEVLGLDPERARGFEAMNILHHLGLKGDFKGLFVGLTEEDAVASLRASGQDFSLTIEHLADKTNERGILLRDLQQLEAAELSAVAADSSEQRRLRISESARPPERIRVYGYAYRRNADIVAEALVRAAGFCERCRNSSPFRRASDNTPYLEVHHIVSLSDGGDDSLANVIALCPNCHREVHYGRTT